MSVHDVVIIGGGIAGLFCALKLAPRPVIIITAAPMGCAGDRTTNSRSG